MGKDEHFRVKDFWNFLLEAEIHATPNTLGKSISIIREKYGKTQIFQIYGFLKNFGWSRNPYNFQNMGKVNSQRKEKIREKPNISKLSVSEFFAWCRNPCRSRNMGKKDFYYTDKEWKNLGGKNTNISNLWVS